MRTQDKALYATSGVIVGILLTLGGLGVAVEKGLLFPDQQPLIQVRTRTIKVPVTVEKRVFVTREAEPKLYRVQLLDDAGKVIRSWDNIAAFQFRIIGAILTDTTGRSFDVDGNISVEPIK